MDLISNFSLIDFSCLLLSLLFAAIIAELLFNFRKNIIEGNTNLNVGNETTFVGENIVSAGAPKSARSFTRVMSDDSNVMSTQNNMSDMNDLNNNLPSVEKTDNGLPVTNDGNQVFNNPIDSRMNTLPQELTVEEKNKNKGNNPNGTSIKSEKHSEIPDIIYKTLKVRQPNEEHPHVFTLIYEPPVIKSELMKPEKESKDKNNVDSEKKVVKEKSQQQKEQEKISSSSFDSKSISSCGTLYDNDESYSKRLHDSRLDFGNMGEINTSIIQGCKP